MLDFDQFSVNEIRQGYRLDRNAGRYHCLYCQASFDDGLIYPLGDLHGTAVKAIANHIRQAHDSPFEQLLQLDKRFIGLTDHQKGLLRLIREGRSNQEIARMTGNAAATVRAQRFLFKEKWRQAKLMLALFELLEEANPAMNEITLPETGLCPPVHATATQIDERFAITAAEKARVIKTYVDSMEPLVINALPVKEKRKLILLSLIAGQFAADRLYTEKEVREVIRPIFADFVTIRRYLIEYGYLGRTPSGSAYWVKNGPADPARTGEPARQPGE